MYEDTPQELVHDLISEAVFGNHPLGRPVIGTAEVISSVSRRAIQGYHRSMYTPANIVVSAAGNLEHDAPRRARAARGRPARRARGRQAARAAAARAHAQARPPLPAQGHRAVPRLPRRARRLALRPAALRGLDPRRDPRRLGVVAPVPGDPREARHGLRRLQLPLASTRTPARSGSTSARARTTSPSALAIAAEQIADIAGGGLRESELERAKENLKGRVLLSMESTSTHMNRLGKALITDSEILSLERIVAEVDAVEPRGGRGAGRAAARAGAAVGGGHRAERGAVPRGARRRLAGARSRGVNVLLNGYSPPSPAMGKVGAALGPRARAGRPRARRDRGRGRRDGRLHGAGRRSCRTSARALAAGVPCVVGTTGWDTAEVDAEAREAGVAGLLRPELRDRRRADDALRGRGVALPRRRPRSSSCTTRRSSTRRRARRRRPRPAMEGDVPIHSVRLPGLVAHQEVILGGTGRDADDPPRHDLARGVRAGRAARAREGRRRCRPA